jgi:hypothetical protein
MADKKISQLSAASTPLAGTEVLPIVQSSTTKQVSVANLTAGRTFEALGVTLTSTDAGATAAPLLDLYRDSASPAASDTLGEIEFNGEDSAGNKQAYGLIHGSILSPTSTAEQGQLHFETATAGALTEKMIIGTTNLVINEIGAVFNVRIEGDTDANLFYTDATNSRVGVGTISPASKFDVAGGDARIDNGNLIIGTSGKGIDFSITSHPAGMTSELFADYEEGTWTPTLIGTTTNPTVTYTLQRGIYTKVGRDVTVSVFLGWSAFSGGSGDVAFGNLPFTIETAVGTSFAGSIALFDGFTLSAARTSVGLLGAGGTTYSLPSCFGSAVSSAYITVGSVAASGVLQYSLTYSV